MQRRQDWDGEDCTTWLRQLATFSYRNREWYAQDTSLSGPFADYTILAAHLTNTVAAQDPVGERVAGHRDGSSAEGAKNVGRALEPRRNDCVLQGAHYFHSSLIVY